MTTSKPQPAKIETAQEEFQRRVKELYALADKMGLRVVITVRRKSPAEAAHLAKNAAPTKREPGEN